MPIAIMITTIHQYRFGLQSQTQMAPLSEHQQEKKSLAGHPFIGSTKQYLQSDGTQQDANF